MAMKWCINCDALFVPHKRESNTQWAKRRFCSRRCAQRYAAVRRTKQAASGPCIDCGVNTVGLREGCLCVSCWQKRRYRSQREKILATNRKWREANPDYWRRPEIVEPTNGGSGTTRSECARSATRLVVAGGARLAGAAVSEVEETEACIPVLRRDPCAYCGGPAGEIDHIEAVSAGGGHVWHNMTSACRSCKATKHDASLLTALLRVY